MKKFLFILMAFAATTLTVQATTVNVTFNQGNNIEGQLVDLNDTTLVIRSYFSATGEKELTIHPERVNYFYISGIGRYNVVDGKFVPDAKAQAKLAKRQAENAAHAKVVSERAANPNLVIGNALKKTGNVCMGIGIPSVLLPGQKPNPTALQPAMSSFRWVQPLPLSAYRSMYTASALLK